MNRKLVWENLTPFGNNNFEQARFRPLEHLARLLAVKYQKYFLSVGTIRADNHAAIGRMRAKNRMRIAMPEPEKALQFLGWNIRDYQVAGFRDLLIMLADFHGYQVWEQSGFECCYSRGQATDQY